MEIILIIKAVSNFATSFIYAHPIIFIIGIGILFYLLQEKAKKNRLKMGLEKTCPHCRETINGGAVVCKHCQRDV